MIRMPLYIILYNINTNVCNNLFFNLPMIIPTLYIYDIVYIYCVNLNIILVIKYIPASANVFFLVSHITSLLRFFTNHSSYLISFYNHLPMVFPYQQYSSKRQ